MSRPDEPGAALTRVVATVVACVRMRRLLRYVRAVLRGIGRGMDEDGELQDPRTYRLTLNPLQCPVDGCRVRTHCGAEGLDDYEILCPRHGYRTGVLWMRDPAWHFLPLRQSQIARMLSE